MYPITSCSVLTTLIIYLSLDWRLKKGTNNPHAKICNNTKAAFQIESKEIRFRYFHTGILQTHINSPGLSPNAGVNPAAWFTAGSRPSATFWCPKKQLPHPPVIITITLPELCTIIPAQSLACNQRRPLAFLARTTNQTACFLSRAGVNVCERQKIKQPALGLMESTTIRQVVSHQRVPGPLGFSEGT